jgi:hypothetical protein
MNRRVVSQRRVSSAVIAARREIRAGCARPNDLEDPAATAREQAVVRGLP